MKRTLLLAVVTAVVVLAATTIWNWPLSDQPFKQPPALKVPSAASQSQTRFPEAPKIRVYVTPGPAKPFTISVDGPFKIVRMSDGRTLVSRKKLKRSTIRATKNGLRIGNIQLRNSRVEIIPARSPSIWVGDHQFRGSVRFIRRPSNDVWAINIVPLEYYIASVVNGETPASFPTEARKAQAIVARTYALYEISQRRHAEFDVYADSRSQQYPGYQYRNSQGRRLAGENETSRSIANSTAGLVCKSRGKLFHAYYSAVCGGRTILGPEVFSDATAAFPSRACHWCENAKRFRWTSSIKHKTLSTSLRSFFERKRLRFGELKSIRPLRTPLGKLPRFLISDGRKQFVLTGDDFRNLLGNQWLPSSRFAIRPARGTWQCYGQGHGHGVGMCQWGAAGMAEAGYLAEQILQFYYHKIQVGKFQPDQQHPFSTSR
ncbi:MAG: hypothetical protein Tsb009_39550 [Planctomycetaceae bacterium]